MTDEFDDLEKELAALRPVEPSAELRDRIAARLTPEAEADAELERELAAMIPAAPSPALAERLAAAQAQTQRPRSWRPQLVFLAAAVAAALMVVFWPPAEEMVEQPVEAPIVDVPTEVPTSPVEDTVDPVAEPALKPALAFSDPRARAMLKAGYKPVSLEQFVVDTAVVEPVADRERQLRVQILQSIRWNHQRTGAQIDTKQLHEAIIRQDLALH